jgi:hypothetical protein
MKAAASQKLAASVPYLRYRALNDENANVKKEAVKTLGTIGPRDALSALQDLFDDSKTPDALRISAAESLITHDASSYAGKICTAALALRGKRQSLQIYNGLLAALSSAKWSGAGDLVRQLLAGDDKQSNTVIEKLYALDIIAANKLGAFSSDVTRIIEAQNTNASIIRRARNTLEKLN